MVLNKSGQSEIACLPDKRGAGIFRLDYDFIRKSKGDPL
jgi:hypothetical protein